jgi:glycyl-tRNA synthetase (class II)
MLTGIYKRTKTHCKNISNSLIGNKNPFYGKHHSEKTKEKMRLFRKNTKPTLGKHWKIKDTSKMNKDKIGKPAKHIAERLGEKHPNWVGNKAHYQTFHKWINSHFGSPNKCELCGRSDKKKYEWASKKHIYTRNINDYIRLCTSCHRKYDLKFN